MKNLWQLKREFLEYCEIEKGQSRLTIENYDRYLSRFLKWLEKYIAEKAESEKKGAEGEVNMRESADISSLKANLTANLITQEVVREYRLFINRLTAKNGQELKATTQNHHALALRAFLRFLAFRGEPALLPEKVTLAKTGDREVTFLNAEEYERLFAAPDTSKTEGLRDKATLLVLFSSGMRVSELTSLNAGQINFERGEIAIMGKGKKLRVVFLSSEAREVLLQYLISRGIVRKVDSDAEESAKPPKFLVVDTEENTPLFVSSRNNRLNARGVERMISKYAKLAGISKKVTPHTLRHTFATDLLRAGADIRSVQSLLGHSNISTTQVYTHVTDQHLREIHQRFHNHKEETTTDFSA